MENLINWSKILTRQLHHMAYWKVNSGIEFLCLKIMPRKKKLKQKLSNQTSMKLCTVEVSDCLDFCLHSFSNKLILFLFMKRIYTIIIIMLRTTLNIFTKSRQKILLKRRKVQLKNRAVSTKRLK